MREQGRGDDALRPIRMQRGYLRDVEGAVLYEAGNTRVLCTATVNEEVPPFLRGQGRGWVTAEYGMLPRSAARRIPREGFRGRSGRTMEIQRLIGRSLRAVTDLTALGERTLLMDCDVIQADGGTRTAAVTGAFLALADACATLQARSAIAGWPLRDYVAAVSVGLLDGRILLDLDYAEDSLAEVDMNVVMTGTGGMVEVQGTAEKAPFSRVQLDALLSLGAQGVEALVERQRREVGALMGGGAMT